MKSRPAIWCGFLVVSLLVLCGFAADGAWLARVPASAASRPNPFAASPDAVSAGRKLFLDHCAQCHGDHAEGSRKHPSLRSERIRNARDGELEWLLTNGNPGKGMPSWSKLPDQQRWQIVRYLKSLDTETAAAPAQ